MQRAKSVFVFSITTYIFSVCLSATLALNGANVTILIVMSKDVPWREYTVYSPALLIYSSLYLFPLDGREKGDYGTMINGHFMKCPIYIYERNAKYRQERNSMCLNILVLKSNQVFIWAVPYLSPKWSAAASAAPC